MYNGWTYESLKYEIKIEKIDIYQRTNIGIRKISSIAEYRIDEQLQNLPIFRAKFWSSKLNKFTIWKNPKMFNLKNCKNLKFEKF